MKMKKVLAAFLAGALALSMTACSGNAAKKIESPDDFEGAKISVQTATTAHDNIQAMLDEGKNIEVLPYEKVTQCFDDLSLGRVDAVYVDSVVAAYYLTDEADKYQKVWTSEEGEPMGICLKKGNTDMLELVEAAVDTLYYNGKIAEIATKHFGSNVTEGVRTVTEEPTLDLSKLSTITDGKLTIGLEAGYPPMEYTDESGLEFIGFDIDLAKELASMFGLEVEFVNTSFDGIFAGLDKGQYDMIIAAVSITPDRQENYEMTEPYVSNQLVIVTKK